MQYLKLKLFSQVLPVKTELFFPVFLIIDLYLLAMTSIKKDLMPQYPDQSFAKLIFGFEVFNLLATLRNGFAVFMHVLDGIEFFEILTTVHQKFVESLWKLYVAVVETYGIKKFPSVRCKDD